MYYCKGRSTSPLPKLKDYSQMRMSKLKTFFHPKTSCSSSEHSTSRKEDKPEHSYLLYQGDFVEVIVPKNSTKKQCKLEKKLPRAFVKPKITISDENQDDLSVKFENDSQIDVRESQELDENNIKFQQNNIKQAVMQINNKINTDLDQSFFSFIKKKEKLQDIVENFGSKLTIVHPGHYYCQHDNLFPKRIDETNCIKDEKYVNFSNYGISQSYFPLVQSLIIKQQSNVKSIKFLNARLNDTQLINLMKYFPPLLKDLNLQDNNLGWKSMVHIADNLFKFQNLKNLNISKNKIGDKGITLLLNSIHKNQSISKLNLSENHLSDQLGQLFFEFLTNNSSVEVLYLNWNQLGSNVGSAIAKALILNKGLKVLDLSYNHIGSNEKSNCLQNWIKALQLTSLVHLDLSYNQLSEKYIRNIDQALQKNNTLYGIHIEGNNCQAYIDPYGFIQIQQTEEFPTNKCQINGVSFIQNQIYSQNCCWICQGWVEHRFQYTPMSELIDNPIFLHLDFLNYKPIPMTSSSELKQQLIEAQREALSNKKESPRYTKQPNEDLSSPNQLNLPNKKKSNRKSSLLPKDVLEELSKFCYTTYQMCPPKRKIKYFFSNPITEQYFIEISEESMASPSDDKILQGNDLKHQFHYFSDGTVLKFKRIHEVNILCTKQEFIIDDKNNYKPLIKIFPRSSEKKYVLRRTGNNLHRKQINFQLWNIEQSIFQGQLQGDNETIMNECFNFDWNCSRINRFVKNDYEQMKLKEYLREAYELIKDVYKFYSSSGYQTQESFCISFAQYIKFASQVGIIDNDTVKIQDAEIDLVSIKNNIDPKYIYNPDKHLVRYQFLEMFFRLANDKYVRTNIVKNHADAVFRLLKEFKDYFKYFDTCQQWRLSRYWNKECECILQLKVEFFKKLYDYIADYGNRKWYFKMKWIAIKEFKEFCRQMGLNDFITEKQIIIVYNFSMQSQPDELTQDRHLRMNQYEFQEALARLAEYLSLPPVGEIQENQQINYYELPLHVKFESLLTYIYHNIIKKNQNFSIFHNLFHLQAKNEFILKGKINAKKDKDDEQIYIPQSQQLSLYNTVTFFNFHKKPYLNPHYQQFFIEKISQHQSRSDLHQKQVGQTLQSNITSLRVIKKQNFDDIKETPTSSPRIRSSTIKKNQILDLNK